MVDLEQVSKTPSTWNILSAYAHCSQGKLVRMYTNSGYKWVYESVTAAHVRADDRLGVFAFCILEAIGGERGLSMTLGPIVGIERERLGHLKGGRNQIKRLSFCKGT